MALYSVASFGTVSDVPLIVNTGAEGNIMFMIDDSGSMHFEVTPEEYTIPYYMFPNSGRGIYGGSGGYYNDAVPSPRWDATDDDERTSARAYRSSSFNKSYYDPSVTYRPWTRADRSHYPESDPENAYHHPVRTGFGSLDLTETLSADADWRFREGLQGGTDCVFWECWEGELSYWPATYFHFEGGDEWDADNYTKVRIHPNDGPYTGHGREGEDNRQDCADDNSCTYEEEIQNFANWYTYYRSRLLSSQAAIGSAFAVLEDEIRVGFGAINEGDSDVDGENTSTIVEGVRAFAGASRERFYEELYERDYPPSNTPLRRALDDAGQYFSRDDSRGPWSDAPGTQDDEEMPACRQSFSIIMTDGYWTENSRYENFHASTPEARANVDGNDNDDTEITGPDNEGFTYDAVSPFADNQDNTLADVAMYYWKRDLLPGLSNEVPTSKRNPAFWQHMVTYGIGLGVTGEVDPDAAFDAIGDEEESINWPNPFDSNEAKVDDLLHAAVNSRGDFFSATNPEEFAKRLEQILVDVQARVETSSTAATPSSAELDDGSERYSAGFRSDDWSGTLTAANIESGSEQWNAEEVLRNQADRRLFTFDGTQGVSLDYDELSPDQQDALGFNQADENDGLAVQRIEWLRGSTASTELRGRSTEDGPRLLGDIVNSDPQLDRKQNYGYAVLPEGDDGAYAGYRGGDDYQDRPRALYAGANDGFLHAFNSDDGEELFGYMPGNLLEAEDGVSYARISPLTDPAYEHRFYVDGTPTLNDAYISYGNDERWGTVLVGSMGAGGRTVFALDVTEPSEFGSGDVLWEFTPEDDEDIGVGIQKPKVVRLATGEWAAIFGNGYDGNGDNGALLVVDLETGDLIHKFEAGDAGVSSPGFTVRDQVVEYIYAGNEDGELWRFDVSADKTNQWGAEKLFEAEDSDGNPQPITAAPRIANHPDRDDTRVISFGTGRFFRVNDRDDTQEQSIYGIFDEDGSSSGLTRDDLQEQSIDDRNEDFEIDNEDQTFEVGQSSNEEVSDSQSGWYIDLDQVEGERVVSEATFPSGYLRERVRFTTTIPDDNPCGTNVDGFIMEVQLGSGTAPNEPVFDIDRDGEFDEGINRVRSGTRGERLSTIRDGDSDRIVDPPGDTPAPDLRSGRGGVGRQSWEQLK
jgi:Tfp pilus assembly protein, tip-associated adhesin PilY1